MGEGRNENLPLTSIRGVAALWVAAGHVAPAMIGIQGPFVAASFTAVDLFFILSGMILATVHANLGLAGIPRFAAKRILRIYPMCFVALTLLLCVLLYPHVSFKWFRQSMDWRLAGSYLLVGAFVDLRTAGNPPAWSAGVEMACYAAFPLAICAIRSLNLFWRAVWLAAAAALSWWIWDDAIAGTLGLGAVARGFVGFGIGMALWALKQRLALGWRAATAFELAGAGELVVAVALGWYDFYTFFSAALLFGLQYDAGPLARVLRNRALLWLGKISFSLYLLHYPLAVAADKFAPMPPGNGWPQAARCAIWLVALLALSSVTYLSVEKPFQALAAWRPGSFRIPYVPTGRRLIRLFLSP